MTAEDTCSFNVGPDRTPDGGVVSGGAVQPDEVLDGEWQCPHGTHADADYCLFHMPVEQREERGISPEDVTTAFLDSVSRSGQEPKEFVGAHFRTLDLEYRTIDVDDRFPIDLRGARIDRLQISDAAVGQPVEATGLSLGECAVEHATLRTDWTLDRAHFEGAVTFRESAFGAELFASETTFESTVEFVETRIDGEATFVDADFADVVDFQECEWHMDVSFVDATFEERAIFDGAEFHGGANVLTDDADFSGAQFADRVSFSKAQFRFANFVGASFASSVSFEGATFERGAKFEETAFDGEATFDRIDFEGDSDFSAATFADRVTCQETTFDGDAVFRAVTFAGPVKLAGSTFSGGSRLLEDDADFSDAHFQSTLDCHLAEFRYAEFEGCVFDGDVNFRRTEYDRGAAFPDVTFDGEVDFYRSRFEGEATFTDSRFADTLRFDEAVFDDDVTFEGIEVVGEARFHGADFLGGAKETDDADFDSATFHERVEFDEADFRYACFTDVTVDDECSFQECRFRRGVTFDGIESTGHLSFRQAMFDGQTRFTGMSVESLDFGEVVFDHDAVLDRSHIRAEANFQGVEFHGGTKRVDDVGFAETTFGGRADFAGAEFRYANYTGATFGAEAVFSEVRFLAGATFDEVAFEGALTCYKTHFDAQASFEQAHARAPMTFDESVFDSDVSFAGLRAEEDVSFRGAEFNGGANDRIEDANFEGARFDGLADFSTAQFRRGNFDDTAFGADAVFTDVRFVLGASFDGTRLAGRLDCTGATFDDTIHFEPVASGDIAVVDLSSATVTDGSIIETGPVYYDMTEATVGDIRLEETEPSINVFDRFLFLNTNFEGFDFSLHRDYLTQNEWRIHDVVFDGEQDLDQFDLVAEPDQLETTYLKARNSAQATGDNKAASEFFILEYVYRRRQYIEIVRDRGLGDPFASLRAGWSWFTNRFFDVTCGFGERPSKVVMASTAIVLFYGVLYRAIGLDVPGEGFTAILVYSFQGFTSLVLGAPQGSTPLTNLATATEGFAGAFFIALFVFSLTRSMNR